MVHLIHGCLVKNQIGVRHVKVQTWKYTNRYLNPSLNHKNFRRILNHEIIEREMMGDLQEEKVMDKETAWNQAHFYVKELGFWKLTFFP